MSVELYARVLWWDSHKQRGLAKHMDIRLDLHESPDVLGHPAFIDYEEVHLGTATIMEVQMHAGERTREMEAPEIEAVRRWFAGAGFAKLLRACLRQARRTG